MSHITEAVNVLVMEKSIFTDQKSVRLAFPHLYPIQVKYHPNQLFFCLLRLMHVIRFRSCISSTRSIPMSMYRPSHLLCVTYTYCRISRDGVPEEGKQLLRHMVSLASDQDDVKICEPTEVLG